MAAVPSLARVPTNAQYEKYLRGVLDEVDALHARLAAGSLDVEKWRRSFSKIIQDGHTGAHAFGRARGGVTGHVGELDRLVGREMLDTESEWLDEFAADLEDGEKYGEPGTEEFLAKRVRWRMRLYAGKMRGTANRAFVEAAADEDIFTWVLGATEKHCSDCPVFAGRTYTKFTIPTYPGAGDTPCLGNCLCYLVRKRGNRPGFQRVLAKA